MSCSGQDTRYRVCLIASSGALEDGRRAEPRLGIHITIFSNDLSPLFADRVNPRRDTREAQECCLVLVAGRRASAEK